MGVCVPEMLQCQFFLQYFNDPSKCQGAVPSPGNQQLPALGCALLLVPQLFCCPSGLVLPQDLALSPCRLYLYLHEVMLLILTGNIRYCRLAGVCAESALLH